MKKFKNFSIKWSIIGIVLFALIGVSVTVNLSNDVAHKDIKQALDNEGIKANYTDNVGEGIYEFDIEGKDRLTVSVLENATEVKKQKNALEKNAHEKQYEVKTFEVQNLLVAYYPSKSQDKELEKKIRKAIFNIKN